MRDLNRIEKYISLLRGIWEKYPDWRFGQLISNIAPYGISSAKFFYIEDEDFFENINQFYKENDKDV